MNHRLLKPLLKQKDQWIEITFPEAFEHIANALKSYSNSETVFFGGGSYSNEELYLIQKIAREGVKTNAICSFEYLTRGSEFQFDKNDIVPFAEMAGASRFFCFGFDLQSPYPTLNVVKQIMEVYPQIPRTFFNQDSKIFIKNFQAFFRAVNYYLVQHQLIKGIYIEGLGKNYQAYASALLSDLYNDLLAENNLQSFDIEYFVNMILVEKNPVYLFWEKALSLKALYELENLCMLTDVQSKQSCGFLGIKENINSQGLFDMGIFPDLEVGGRKQETQRNGQEASTQDILHNLLDGKYKNGLIFGENPVISLESPEIINALKKIPFLVVQTPYFTETAQGAHLILPATLPTESDGIYTDCTRVAHPFKKEEASAVELNNLQQLSALGEKLGLPSCDDHSDLFLEYISFFKAGCHSHERHFFRW
ncbi:MAG: hypothetical protein RR356_00365 [Bacteroidales bacterium]